MYAAGWHDAMTARAARPGGRGGPGGVGGRPIAGPGQGHRRGAGAVSPGAPRTVRAEAPPDVVFGVEEWVEVTESPPEADVSASDEFDEEWSPNRDADGSQSEDDDEFAILEEEEEEEEERDGRRGRRGAGAGAGERHGLPQAPPHHARCSSEAGDEP